MIPLTAMIRGGQVTLLIAEIREGKLKLGKIKDIVDMKIEIIHQRMMEIVIFILEVLTITLMNAS